MGIVPPAIRSPDRDPDLGLMEDEQLVVLARESGSRPARDELLARSSRQRVGLVRQLARDAGLTEADQSDAQQEAVLWTFEAIQHFRTEPPASPGACSFRSFLHRVVTCRFVDYLRHRHRHHRHFVNVGATIPTELDRSLAVARAGVPGPGASGRQQEFEDGELNDRLQQQLDQLGVRTRRLWEMLAQGSSVLEISAVLHISYDAAKRRRRKLLIHLRKILAVKG